MKSILAASDLSARSDRAVRRAFSLASASGARLTIITVIDSELPEEVVQDMRKTAETRLRRFCETVPEATRVEWEARSDVGDPLTDLHAAAREVQADLVVLGIHRRRPLRDLVRGTTMERLVRGTKRPVLLVSDAADHVYSKVLVGIDLSPACAAALRCAREVAPGAEIISVHAFTIPFKGFIAPTGSAAEVEPYRQEAERDLRDWLSRTDLPEGLPEPLLIEGSPNTAFRASFADHKPDLIAVGAHGRGALNPSLLGSFTEELIATPPCDVLVVRR